MPGSFECKKKCLRFIITGVVCCFLAGLSYGQDSVPLLVSGRKQSTIPATVKNEVTYVNAQKTARQLGASVEFFARSKQAKITARGFYAILTAGLEDIVLNAQTTRLSAPVLEEGGELFVPVEFFLLPSFQQAIEKEISFEQGSLQVERPFTLERLENRLFTTENQLVFKSRRQITWSSSSPDAHTVRVVFPDVTVKRDEHFRLKTPFIASASIRRNVPMRWCNLFWVSKLNIGR